MGEHSARTFIPLVLEVTVLSLPIQAAKGRNRTCDTSELALLLAAAMRTILLSDRIRDLLYHLAALAHSKRRENTGYRSPFGTQLTVEVSVALTARRNTNTAAIYQDRRTSHADCLSAVPAFRPIHEVTAPLTACLLGRWQDLHLLYVRLREVTQNLATVCTENIASGVFSCARYTPHRPYGSRWIKRRENTGSGVCRGWHGCPCGLVKESNLSYRSIRCTYYPVNSI